VREGPERTSPAVEARAAREGAGISGGDETGVRANGHPGRGYARLGQTPVPDVSGEHFRVNGASATTNRGDVRSRTDTRTWTTAVSRVFLGRLRRGARKQTFLSLDRHTVHEAGAVADGVQAHAERIAVFLLPRRAPGRDADGYLSKDLEGRVHAERLPDTREEWESTLRGFMHEWGRLRAHVRRYFQHPEVQYAAATPT
jgi:hypothetical protein